MKTLLSIIIIITQLFSQDTLFTNDEILPGRLIEIKEETVKFWPNPLPGKFTSSPKEYSKEDVIRVIDDRKEVFSSNNIDSLIRVNCENNKKISMVVIPIKDDYYGSTDDLLKSYDRLCFNLVSNINSLQFLEENNIMLSDVNDFHLIKIGKALNIDKIIYGYAYSIEKSINYQSTGVANSLPLANSFNSFNDVIDFLPNILYMVGEEKKRSNAMQEAGIYILLTLFEIDIETQKKSYLLKNYKIITL